MGLQGAREVRSWFGLRVAVGPDRCGLAVCVVLVSFSKISQARSCLVPESGTYPPAPERPELGAFEKRPMVEVLTYFTFAVREAASIYD